MRNTLVKFLAGSLAAASLMAFSAPVYAASAEQSSAQGQAAGWCEVVPTFCDAHCGRGGPAAKCNPCVERATGVKARDSQLCAANRED